MITTTEHPAAPNPRHRWTAHAPALDWTEHGATEQVAVFRLRERAAERLLSVRRQLRALAEIIADDANADYLRVRIIGDRIRASMVVNGEMHGFGEGDTLPGAINDLFRRLDAQLSPLLCVAGRVVPAPSPPTENP